MIDLTYIPYHDWRKILFEGNRTRDAHFIESLRENKNVGKLLIINRPITYAELVIKKKTYIRRLKNEIVYKNKRGILYKIDEKTFLMDFLFKQNIAHTRNGRKWYFDAYGNKNFLSFYRECLKQLNIEDGYTVSSNIFSYKFISSIKTKKIIDAWDNFNLIPDVSSVKDEILQAYQSLASDVDQWVTNSEENVAYYSKHFNIKNISIIKNGVSVDRFKQDFKIPKELDLIRQRGKKIVGFGGKITHLFDTDLFNYIASYNKDFDFVIVGQIIDKKVFSKIKFKENVFYLGDKHYDIYPSYIKNFDVGIVPYKINEEQHGGDSIKVYEYLAAGLAVVGTRGNGLQYLEKYINIADNHRDFSEFISSPSSKEKIILSEITWDKKVNQLLKKLLEL